MSGDLFNISWFVVFIVVILIAFVANTIIILAILRDKTMHTSTYFYIINVNIADILLVLSCLPERITALFRSNDGFHLGLFTCYLLPFLQQVSMHAALGFLLILTVHRCYPAGVPRCLQRNAIRQQIRNHSRTLCLVWIFAILINLPLFSITKYERYPVNMTETKTNLSRSAFIPSCDTEATEIWSRTYLILLLVLTYLITGIFLIVIYGQVIRIILSSDKVAHTRTTTRSTQSRFFSRTVLHRGDLRETPARSSTSSSLNTTSSHRRQQQNVAGAFPISITTPKCSLTHSHSTQHLQVIVMLFIVILLYILLLLPYRLLNLLFIVHNQLFQYNLMNDILFLWLLNTVRLLVFLNCALQPIIYLVISSRLRQTVATFIHLCWHHYSCQCHFSFTMTPETHFPTHNRTTQTYHRSTRCQTTPCKNHPSTNNPHIITYQPIPAPLANRTKKIPFTFTFTNTLHK